MKMTLLFIFVAGDRVVPALETQDPLEPTSGNSLELVPITRKIVTLALSLRLIGFIISRGDGLVITNRHASGHAGLDVRECLKEARLTLGYSGCDIEVETKTVVL